MIRHAKTQELERVMVYGAAWCENSTHICRLLAQWGVPYHFIDVELDGYAQSKVARWNLGELVIPAVSCGSLEDPRLVNPTDAELHGMLYTCQDARVGPLLL